MKTKEKIILESLVLFNDQGCKPITTNHIAQSLGISPGNLYYHYSCKEEIIREIMVRYANEIEEVLSVKKGWLPSLADKAQLLESIFDIVWKYRFFFREQDQLLSEDTLLAQKNREFFQSNLKTTYQLHVAMRSSGIIDATDHELEALTLNAWVTITSWMSFAKSYLGGSEEEGMSVELARHCIYQVFSMERPFLTSNSKEELDQIENKYRCDEIKLTLFN